MITQITITKNELYLMKEMMPLWRRYADAFVFMLDECDDGTEEWLTENREKYNIVSILQVGKHDNVLRMESDIRQRLFDEAYRHSNHIICLDTDEYLDGSVTKEQLENILSENEDTLIQLHWIQYTGKNQIRVDGPWRYNLKDRVASYKTRGIFKRFQMHSEHLPEPTKQGFIDVPFLFIAHIQWLDKPTVAVKQYCWKVFDFVNKTVYHAATTPPAAYDASVNNFVWEYSEFPIPLKVSAEIYQSHDITTSFKYKFIKDSIKKYNIPNLNDWGMGIH